MTGAAIVKDTSANIAEMLDEAIASTVKDINVDDNSTDNKLVLTVSQFRNLPGYSSDSVIIQDSEANISRALSFGTLDGRVTTLSLTSDKFGDGGLTLNAATANKLVDFDITKADGTPLNLVIRDRASVIADYVETGSLSEKFRKDLSPYSTNSESELPS